MPWKNDENGALSVDEKGNPIWVFADGKESGFDYSEHSTAKKEAMERKEKIRELEKQIEPFKGIENAPEWIAEARKALDAAANAPDAQKAQEEQIRARIEAATKPLNDKIALSTKEAETLRQQLYAEAVGNSFARSAFVREKMVDHVMAADLFKRHFTMKDGQVVALGENGEPIYGENGIATFDEAMAKLVESSPYKLNLLKGNDKSGSGAPPGSGGGGSNGQNKLKPLSECKTDAEKIAWIKAKTEAAA